MATDHDTSKCAVFHDFAGKRRRFLLRIGEMEELEQHCGAGIGAIMLRVSVGQFSVADIWQTIRLGLIGGGEQRAVADKIVGYMQADGEPIYNYIAIPASILRCSLMGVAEKDTSGNDDAAE